MPTAAQLTAELEAAGVPTYRPAIQQLAARRAIEQHGYDIKAYIRALPVADQLDLVDLLAHQLSEWSGSDLIGKGADSIRDEIGPQVGGEPILYLEDRAVRGVGL